MKRFLEAAAVITIMGLIGLEGCLGSAQPSSDPLTTKATPGQLKFESPEHWALGSAILLQIPNATESPNRIPGNLLILKQFTYPQQSLQLSYADLVWLSGDFIGEPGIVVGKAQDGISQTNFLQNLAALDHYSNYLPGIIQQFNQIIQDNEDNIRNGHPLVIGDQSDVAFNCATGGSCTLLGMLLKPGLYLKLAEANYDHFGQFAINSYLTGHRLALATASRAKSKNDLFQAYAIEAYASHFLSDLFASGHVRTPRHALEEYCHHAIPNKLAAYFAKIMHDEDNQQGLWLQDNRGQRWRAYGDRYLFTAKDYDNYLHLTSVMQQAADQVFNAYQTHADPSLQQEWLNDISDYLPNLERIRHDSDNPPARYISSDGIILKYNHNDQLYHRLNCIDEAASLVGAELWNLIFH